MPSRLLKTHRLPVQIEGLPYILGGALLTLSSAMVWRAPEAVGGAGLGAALATGVFSLFTAFSAWFYRCPSVRTPEGDSQAVLSPADGRVLKTEEVDGRRIGAARAAKISIFMSPLDVHVNRAPVSGVIETVDYTRGKFFKADLDKASEENEHSWIVMKMDQGPRIAFAQIAGFIARRIVCYVASGERLARGERYGMIRFGSRMEIVVPADAEILVRPGEKTVAGVTKVARLRGQA